MKKSQRIAEFVARFGSADAEHPGIHLAGYLECFDSGHYYEAHDVLEDFWLRQGKGHPDHAFHKGLIQLAGGFVHLRLHFLHAGHPKHGRRLAPARRLFLLAAANLRPYASGNAPVHLGIDVERALVLAEGCAALIEAQGCNPWQPDELPCLGGGNL